MQTGNLTELEKANKALDTANQQIAELQKNNAIRDLREKAMTDFKVTAEQAKAIVKEDGSFDTAELGKIMSEKRPPQRKPRNRRLQMAVRIRAAERLAAIKPVQIIRQMLKR